MRAGQLSRKQWQRVGDAALAALLLVLGVAEIWQALPSRQGSGSPWWTTLSVVVCTVPLVVRRTRPLLAVTTISVGMALLYLGFPLYVLFYGQFVAIALATFSVARHGQGRERFYGAAAAAGVAAFGTVFVPELRSLSSAIFDWAVLATAWVAGFALSLFEHRAAASRQLAVDTEVAAAKVAMTAVLEERARIARELHDIVAHAVSVIVVQAGSAEPIVEEDPAYVRAALRTIRTTGTGALGEMRRVVTMLRDIDDPQPLAPQPGVDALAGLIEHAQQGGLDASLEVDGSPRALPVGLDLAAYRIVQEALSNIRRHATASRAWVLLTYESEAIRIEVRDDGVGAGAAVPGGHGLIGMRERAALYGGQLETSSEAGRGFIVRATLPMLPA